MQQYYYGKVDKDIEDLKNVQNFNEIIFSNNSFDETYDYINFDFERCTFSNISFKKTKIQYSKFTHCVFVRCYFKEIYFNKIDFCNCIFIECGFFKTKIEDCKFFFTEWKDSYIKFDELYRNLPSEYNYRKKLCKSMAKNCLKNSNITEYKKYFWEEKYSTENHYKEIILRRKDYYKNNYNWYNSMHYLIKFISCKFNRIVWGYGESLKNIILSGIVVIVIFTVIYYCITKNINNSFYFSVCNFLTINCNYSINNSLIDFLTTIEGFCGIAFIGLFTASLFREISR